jgi:alpha-tubulin suppressor-like RCC1 family protein/subtilisin family serine protease
MQHHQSNLKLRALIILLALTPFLLLLRTSPNSLHLAQANAVLSHDKGGALAQDSQSVPAISPDPVTHAQRIEEGSAPVQARAPGKHDLMTEIHYFDKAKVISSKETIDEQGRKERVRLLETNFKYPLIRVKEIIGQNRETGAEEVISRQEMVGDHIVVKLAPGVTEDTLNKINQKYGGTIRKKMLAPNTYLVAFAAQNVDALPLAISNFQNEVSNIAYVEPDYIAHAIGIPNDTKFSQLWGMHNTGQTGGTADADIDAPEAWGIATGSSAVKVGVIDTGVDYNHQDLAANIWTNSGEIPGNGIDDDANGFIDDVRGWNFYGDNNNPMDDNEHGSHCSGTIGGVGNNATGVAGVNWRVSIVPIKFLSGSGSGSLSDGVDAIYYATKVGVHLTSNSWGGSGFMQSMKDAIEDANQKGILFVAAAGNSYANSDTSPLYPAAYNNGNIVSVAATDHKDQLAYFSNYGATSVDLGAPGVNVVSSTPNNTYQSFSGTSMACPHVAGVCALMKSASPGLSHQDLKTFLLSSVDPIPALTGKCVTGGRLNARKALESLGIVILTNTLDDDSVNGTSGNQDNIINPGELVGFNITLKNSSTRDVNAVTATLSLAGSDSAVSIVQNTASFGNISASGSASGAAQYRIQISPSVPTPHEVSFVLTITDNTGTTWVRSFTKTIYTSSQVSGRIYTATGQNPLSGATVAFSGPMSGSATTGPSGTYSITLVDGIYTLVAKSNGYVDSDPRSITVPPSVSNVDFPMGNPDINSTPASLSLTVNEGSAANPSLTLQNLGDARLGYKVLGEVFEVKNSDDAGGPAYSWMEISSTGTRVSLGDDYNVGPFPMGFNFPFYGKLYDRFRLCSNGWITFSEDNSSSQYSNTELPSLSAPKNMIAFFWDDLNFTNAGAAYYKLIDPNTFVIQFKDVPYYANSTSKVSCELILKSDGTILMQYARVDISTQCTVGFQNESSDSGVQVVFNGAYLHNNMAIKIAPKFGANWLSVTPSSDSIAAANSKQLSVVCAMSNLNPGSYSAVLGIASNDPDEPEFGVPVNVIVKPATIIPSAPSNLTAVAAIGNTVNLSWTDNSNNETGFYLERKIGTNGTFVRLATLNSGVTAFQDRNLIQGTQYFYRLASKNSVGSSYSNIASVTTLPAPNAPSNLVATTVSGSRIDLSWIDNSNNEHGFFIKVESTAQYFWVYASPNATSSNVTGLTPGTTYTFVAYAYNSEGDSTPSNSATATTIPKPAAPSNLTATLVSTTQADLRWVDHSNNETNFLIQRKVGSGSYTTLVTLGANVTSYSNTGLTLGKQYSYRVLAKNIAGNSAYSNVATVTPSNTPVAPKSLTAVVVSATRVDLAWTDDSFNESGFKIERKLDTSGTYASIGTVGAGVSSYSDATTIGGNLYFYRVSATNSYGDSPYSNEASALPGAPVIYGAVAGGTSHSVGVSDNGSVWTWGGNVSGQLGNNSTINSLVPIQVVGLNDIVQVAAGANHTLALSQNGDVWTWGSNSGGQLGDGSLVNKRVPVFVIGNMEQVAGGYSHTAALKADGTVWTWGDNAYGQLGIGTTNRSTVAVQVTGLASNVTAVAARGYHTVALKANGTVWTWGHNAYGQLGIGTTNRSTVAVQVAGLSNIVAIASGKYHTLALDSSGKVWSWGINGSGQLGNGTLIGRSTPGLVSNLTSCVEIIAGDNYTIAIAQDRKVWTCGYGNYGQLGNGLTENRSTPVRAQGLANILGIGAGGTHGLALGYDGAVWTWGSNGSGQLGIDTTTKKTVPGKINLDLITQP